MEKQTIEYQKIFVAGSQPEYTYNPRESLQLESRLTNAIKTPGKVIVVTGPTKSGKTVLVRRILPPDRAIWIDGGPISGATSPEEEFWQVIVDGLDLAQTHQKQITQGSSKNKGIKGELETGFVILKGSAGLTFDVSDKQENTLSSSKQLSSRITAVNSLKRNHIPIVIDDFHYLPKDLQKNVIRSFKSLIYDGLPVVIITIPHRREEPIKVEREMTGRTMTIEIPIWEKDELQFIPAKGFSLLGYDISNQDCLRLAEESIGSPHLMQDFCLNLCLSKNLKQLLNYDLISISNDEIDSILRDVAKNTGRSMFEKLARGPRQRKDRIQRELLDGGCVDIYQLVLIALAKMNPSLSGIEYTDVRDSIRGIAVKLPNVQAVARVLRYMSRIAASDLSSTPVLDFDEEEQKLHITDPFFAFYLRWGDLTFKK